MTTHFIFARKIIGISQENTSPFDIPLHMKVPENLNILHPATLSGQGITITTRELEEMVREIHKKSQL